MEWERARTEEQKDTRIDEIVSATERLYEKYSYDEITFVLIAEEAEFTRSNLYKYFNSKEEIFLEFLKTDVQKISRELVRKYPDDRTYTPEVFTDIWVNTISRNKRFIELHGILFPFLENHSSIDRITDFKLKIKNELTTLTGLLCRIFPKLTPENAVRFLHLQFASAIGLYQMTNLSEVQKKVLERPDLKEMRVDFDECYKESVQHLLSGLMSSHKECGSV